MPLSSTTQPFPLLLLLSSIDTMHTTNAAISPNPTAARAQFGRGLAIPKSHDDFVGLYNQIAAPVRLGRSI